MLYRLSNEASCLVTRELVSGHKPRYTPAECQPYLDETERRVELDAFDAAIDQLVRTTKPYDTAIDAAAAAALHRALPLSRREAADPGIWRFLAIVQSPEFVRHRWEARSWATMRSRFWRPGTRPDSNAIGRLWWIAELSHDGESYDLTTRALARQPLATPIFVRQFSFYRPAIEAFVRVLSDAPAEQIEKVGRQFNALLSTIVLESQSADELAVWLNEIRDDLR